MSQKNKKPAYAGFLCLDMASDVQNAHREEPQDPLRDNGGGKGSDYGTNWSSLREQEEAKQRKQDRRAEQVHEQLNRGAYRCAACINASATRSGRWGTPMLNHGA
ncbi:hypothetical protein [Burkholderia vietnamiensis]|uniref:hypothetical protein n=1 Tax=Burkholderia vietnamiensis TaxID=60552 RepID=UPI001594608E|nr:hypothetical protein [Burkholderia vietnamiensis]